MVEVRQVGDYLKLKKYLNKISKTVDKMNLDKYGQKGVAALKSATPVDTGLTADSWEYEIVYEDGSAKIIFNNTNVQKYVNIAIIIQYGHATKNGGWVEGRDYINPAIQPVFDEIAEEAWKEVTRV